MVIVNLKDSDQQSQQDTSEENPEFSITHLPSDFLVLAVDSNNEVLFLETD